MARSIARTRSARTRQRQAFGVSTGPPACHGPWEVLRHQVFCWTHLTFGPTACLTRSSYVKLPCGGHTTTIGAHGPGQWVNGSCDAKCLYNPLQWFQSLDGKIMFLDFNLYKNSVPSALTNTCNNRSSFHAAHRPGRPSLNTAQRFAAARYRTRRRWSGPPIS